MKYIYRLLLLTGLLVPVLIGTGCSGNDRAPEQPIAFSHKQHVEANFDCRFCHQHVTRFASAGIPSVQLCMACHSFTKTDSPEVQKVAAYFERKEEIPWVRLYGFEPEAWVYFNHSRHVAAEVECSACHGDVGQTTVTERAVDHNMGWCMSCHDQNRSKFDSPELATDCQTCHF